MKKILILIFGLVVASAVVQGNSGMTDEDIRNSYYKSYRSEKLQNYDDAIKAILPVLTAYPQGYTVNLRLGWLYYLNGNYANAKQYYQAAMKIAPASIEAKLGYTLPIIAQERYDETENVTRQIIRVDVSNYYANLRLAFALRMLKKYDQAEEIVNRMLTLYPTEVKFLMELGLLKVAQDKRDAARRIFNDVIILDPENLVAKEQLNAATKSSDAKNTP